jgi:hypothetical protein
VADRARIEDKLGGVAAFSCQSSMLEIAWLDAGVKSTPRDFASSAGSSGPVAQWIEHLIPNQGVAGSNPAGVAISQIVRPGDSSSRGRMRSSRCCCSPSFCVNHSTRSAAGCAGSTMQSMLAEAVGQPGTPTPHQKQRTGKSTRVGRGRRGGWGLGGHTAHRSDSIPEAAADAAATAA